MSGKRIAIIGAGPAGLIAAETLAQAGQDVIIYDRMPSPGRKFLMAGRGGLNLTHSESLEKFMTRYGREADWLSPAIAAFPPEALRQWCENLGEPTFIGSSGRVFPKSFKASPLLRAWLKRLTALGVTFAFGHLWQGWTERGALRFRTSDGGVLHDKPDAVLLALGGASWPRLGSDGHWTGILEERGIAIAPLRPANCGFAVAWPDDFIATFAGHPVKTIMLNFAGRTVPGELMLTTRGIEGGAVYALSGAVRDALECGPVLLHIDLRLAIDRDELERRLTGTRKRQSFSTWLRKDAGLSDAALALFKQCTDKAIMEASPGTIATAIKALPLTVTAPFPIDRAISSAGGIPRAALNKDFMLKDLPGIFAAGEMLDWEAPTGGYLLQGCFSTGVAAARGIGAFLSGNEKPEG